MRPRLILMLMGFLTAVLSLLALAKNTFSPRILGATISDKIEIIPASPTMYFVLFLAIGIISILVALMERKIVY